MSQTIYVVLGSTGEYSDRGEWLSKAFHTEAEARAFVAFLTEKRQQIAVDHVRLDWELRSGVEEKMRAFDPNYQEDYTGTRWFVSPVELVASAEAGQ